MGGKEARPESARASASMGQAQELSGQLGLCLPTELRENELPKPGPQKGLLDGQATSSIFGSIRGCCLGEECTVCQGLGPRALESYVQEGGKGQDAAL